ncbi:MAG: hypothetical protein ABIH86_06880 [Planctomycetota bacterium]
MIYRSSIISRIAGLVLVSAFFTNVALAESGVRLVISDWSLDTSADGAARISVEIRNHSRHPALRPELLLARTPLVESVSIADIVLARTLVDTVIPSGGSSVRFSLSVSATANDIATSDPSSVYQLTVRCDDRGVRIARMFRSSSLASRPDPVVLAALTGRPFNGYRDIEIADYSFSRDQNALFIRGMVRNGLNETVESIQTTLSFQRFDRSNPAATPVEISRHSFFIPGRLAPGQTRGFITETTAITGFDDIVETVCVRRMPDETTPPVNFAGIESLEAAFLRFEDAPDSGRLVQFAIRNGLPERLNGAVFVLTFYAQNRAPVIERLVVDKPFERGEIDFFSRTVSYAGGYDGFDWRVEAIADRLEPAIATEDADIR